MGYFLTAKSRIEQTDTKNYWKLVDNELYMSNDGTISITPRYFWTDGYSFPYFIMPFIGDRNSLDVRPAHAHDLFCRFHQRIIVDLSLKELIEKGYLHDHNGIIVCEDLPKYTLNIIKIKKTKADDLIKEMMLSCKIPEKICNIIRFGVFFNFNWLRTGKKDLYDYRIFYEDIGLVNGF